MPNTREKLIELLDSGRMCHTVCSSRGHPVRTFESRMVDEGVVELLADHLIAHNVTVQEWISVKDRLPEENTAVLTYRESGIQAEFRWHKGWDNDEFTPCQVTHWMPLPEPPKGE